MIEGTSTETYFYDPVFKYYEPHKGEIVTIKFSPDRKDLFLTSGTDGEIRIYRIDQVSIKIEHEKHWFKFFRTSPRK